MATIKDVARLAGVSATTVSRVLNSGTGSRDVVERVRSAARELDYEISAAARGLTKGYTNYVGVAVADIGNPPISSMFQGISAHLHERGLNVMLGTTGADEAVERDVLKMFAVQRARGVIYAGSHISDEFAVTLNGFPVPLVVAAQENPLLDWPAVLFDNYRAAHSTVSFFVEDGHREIAFVSGPLTDVQAGIQRQRGYQDALATAGIETPTAYLQHAEFSIDSGYAAMKRIVDSGVNLPTVVFGASDLIAIGAMRLLRDRGIAVPDSVSVFGFDDIPVAAKMVPSLSSVEVDFYELGVMCAEMLVRLFDRRKSSPRRITFDHRVIVRDSYRGRNDSFTNERRHNVT